MSDKTDFINENHTKTSASNQANKRVTLTDNQN